MKNKCKECGGMGQYAEPPYLVCETCNGTGDGDYKYPLTLNKLQRRNYARSTYDIKVSNNWTPLEWGGALAGETGELCNMLKKLRRGEKVDIKDIAHELADVIIYADLLASKMNINLEEAVIEKFNIVSKRWKSKYTL